MHDSFMPLAGSSRCSTDNRGDRIRRRRLRSVYHAHFCNPCAFIAGRMVGRTRFTASTSLYEMTLTTIHILIPIILGLTAMPRSPGTIARLQPTGFWRSCMRSVGFPEQWQCICRFVIEQRLLQPCHSISNVRRAMPLPSSPSRSRICSSTRNILVSDGTLRDHRAALYHLARSRCLSSVHSRTSRACARAHRGISLHDRRRAYRCLTVPVTRLHRTSSMPFTGAFIDVFLKLDPRTLYHNVVMFTVEIRSRSPRFSGSRDLEAMEASAGFIGAIADGSGSPFSLPILQRLVRMGSSSRGTE